MEKKKLLEKTEYTEFVSKDEDDETKMYYE
jgi:hypothetical protein